MTPLFSGRDLYMPQIRAALDAVPPDQQDRVAPVGADTLDDWAEHIMRISDTVDRRHREQYAAWLRDRIRQAGGAA